MYFFERHPVTKNDGRKKKTMPTLMLCTYCGQQGHLEKNCLVKFMQQIPDEQKSQQGFQMSTLNRYYFPFATCFNHCSNN